MRAKCILDLSSPTSLLAWPLWSEGYKVQRWKCWPAAKRADCWKASWPALLPPLPNVKPSARVAAVEHLSWSITFAGPILTQATVAAFYRAVLFIYGSVWIFMAAATGKFALRAILPQRALLRSHPSKITASNIKTNITSLSGLPYEFAPAFGILNCFTVLLSERWCLEQIELAVCERPAHDMPRRKPEPLRRKAEPDVRYAFTGAG